MIGRWLEGCEGDVIGSVGEMGFWRKRGKEIDKRGDRYERDES